MDASVLDVLVGLDVGHGELILRVRDVRRVQLVERAVGAGERPCQLRDDDVVPELGLVGEDRDGARLDLVDVLALDYEPAVAARCSRGCETPRAR